MTKSENVLANMTTGIINNSMSINAEGKSHNVLSINKVSKQCDVTYTISATSVTSSFVNESIGKEHNFKPINLINLVNSSIPIKEMTKSKHLKSKQEF
jgi:hypothetical protein